jgi:hypothetical protein
MLRELAKAKAIVGQDVPLQGREREERVERDEDSYNCRNFISRIAKFLQSYRVIKKRCTDDG